MLRQRAMWTKALGEGENGTVQSLLRLSRAIDWMNARFGSLADWMVLLSVLISAGNAALRYLFSYSSNGFVEIQWYLFGASVFLGRLLYAQTERACQGRRRLLAPLAARPALCRRLRADRLPAAGNDLPRLAVVAGLRRSPMRSARCRRTIGGLIRWPILLVLPVGFALLTLQGISELIKRIAALRGDVVLDTELRTADPIGRDGAPGRKAELMFQYGVIPPLMFGALIVVFLIGFPVAFSLAALGLAFGVVGIVTGHFEEVFLQALPLSVLRHRLQRAPARHSLLHLHGRDPRALRPRRGPARGHRSALRQDPRRPRLCGHPGRRGARRDHRHGGGIGHRHGGDRAAGDEALRLRHEARHRRHRRVGHHHAAHPALARAHRARRAARPLGGRHVSRRDRPLDPADSHLRGLRRRAVAGPSRHHAAAAAGSAHRTRTGARRSRWRRAWSPRSS